MKAELINLQSETSQDDSDEGVGTDLVGDQLDVMLARICGLATADGCIVTGITAGERAVGVTSIAKGFARRASRLGKTLLIDANLNHPKLARHFRVAKSPGFLDVAAEAANVEAALKVSVCDQLDLLPLGSRDHVNANSPTSIRQLINQLRADYAHIVCDLPYVANSVSALGTAAAADGVVVVIDASSGRVAAAKDALATLELNQINVLGVVLNRAAAKRRSPFGAWF